jgi:hypothetical protein
MVQEAGLPPDGRWLTETPIFRPPSPAPAVTPRYSPDNQRVKGSSAARYLAYYHQARTHLALDKDAPDVRPIKLPMAGKIVQLSEVSGLHHRYLRQAA